MRTSVAQIRAPEKAIAQDQTDFMVNVDLGIDVLREQIHPRRRRDGVERSAAARHAAQRLHEIAQFEGCKPLAELVDDDD